MTIDYSQALTFMLVMMRMTGMIVLNPIFGRSNVPTMLSAGLSMLLAMLITPVVTPVAIADPNFITFAFMVLKELSLGLIGGFVMRLFLSVLIVGGEIADMQLGISMSKAFDPGTNSSISVTSGFMNAMFIIIFFVTNNHLTFINLMAQTFEMIPPGAVILNFGSFDFIPKLFTTILIFAMKLCMPIVVMEIVVTMAVGIIMRIIPQINVFVVNIQFKLLVGFLTLVTLVGPMIGFFENLVTISLERILEAWSLMAM